MKRRAHSLDLGELSAAVRLLPGNTPSPPASVAASGSSAPFRAPVPPGSPERGRQSQRQSTTSHGDPPHSHQENLLTSNPSRCPSPCCSNRWGLVQFPLGSRPEPYERPEAPDNHSDLESLPPPRDTSTVRPAKEWIPEDPSTYSAQPLRDIQDQIYSAHAHMILGKFTKYRRAMIMFFAWETGDFERRAKLINKLVTKIFARHGFEYYLHFIYCSNPRHHLEQVTKELVEKTREGDLIIMYYRGRALPATDVETPTQTRASSPTDQAPQSSSVNDSDSDSDSDLIHWLPGVREGGLRSDHRGIQCEEVTDDDHSKVTNCSKDIKGKGRAIPSLDEEKDTRAAGRVIDARGKSREPYRLVPGQPTDEHPDASVCISVFRDMMRSCAAKVIWILDVDKAPLPEDIHGASLQPILAAAPLGQDEQPSSASDLGLDPRLDEFSIALCRILQNTLRQSSWPSIENIWRVLRLKNIGAPKNEPVLVPPAVDPPLDEDEDEDDASPDVDSSHKTSASAGLQEQGQLSLSLPGKVLLKVRVGKLDSDEGFERAVVRVFQDWMGPTLFCEQSRLFVGRHSADALYTLLELDDPPIKNGCLRLSMSKRLYRRFDMFFGWTKFEAKQDVNTGEISEYVLTTGLRPYRVRRIGPPITKY